MMTNEKWNVRIGERVEAISSDLLTTLGYSAPYSNDENRMARWDRHYGYPDHLAEGYARGLMGDAAALEAIRILQERRHAQTIETARQKVAEIELKAAEERRVAEGIAMARVREQKKG